MPNATERKGGRPKNVTPKVRKKSGNVAKPVVAGQLEFDEHQRMETLIEELSRSQSYMVRMAIVRLLRDHLRGHIDWTKAPEAQGELED